MSSNVGGHPPLGRAVTPAEFFARRFDPVFRAMCDVTNVLLDESWNQTLSRGEVRLNDLRRRVTEHFVPLDREGTWRACRPLLEKLFGHYRASGWKVEIAQPPKDGPFGVLPTLIFSI